VEKSGRQKRKSGFTLIELLTTIAMLGVLAGIAFPTFSVYRMKAEKVVIDLTLDFLMDAQDLYFVANDEFYPNKGKVNIKKGKEKEISELAYTFPSGHKHRYIIYSKNTSKVNTYYVEVRADYDFNGNGQNDRFRYTTLYRKGKQIKYRVLRQYK
jgi:type IV pilus assembly protein PilE